MIGSLRDTGLEALGGSFATRGAPPSRHVMDAIANAILAASPLPIYNHIRQQ